MKQNLNYSGFIFFFIILFMTSCNKEKTTYLEYSHISEDGWKRSTELFFHPEISDNNAIYNLKIELRHTNDYPYQNIWFFTSISHKDSILLTDTLEYSLSNDFGKWHARGYNALYQQTLLYKKDYLFPDTGKYTIRIQQAMRDNPLLGIENVGFRIEKSNSNGD